MNPRDVARASSLLAGQPMGGEAADRLAALLGHREELLAHLLFRANALAAQPALRAAFAAAAATAVLAPRQARPQTDDRAHDEELRQRVAEALRRLVAPEQEPRPSAEQVAAADAMRELALRGRPTGSAAHWAFRR